MFAFAGGNTSESPFDWNLVPAPNHVTVNIDAAHGILTYSVNGHGGQNVIQLSGPIGAGGGTVALSISDTGPSHGSGIKLQDLAVNGVEMHGVLRADPNQPFQGFLIGNMPVTNISFNAFFRHGDNPSSLMFQVTGAPVPEPSIAAMAILGGVMLFLAGGFAKRRGLKNLHYS
jgi:hypothetical protein